MTMASGGRYASSSTESDGYYPASLGKHYSGDNSRVSNLTSNLRDTTRNLKTLDHMLDSYRDVSQDQRSSNDRMRGELNQTLEDLREERARGTQLNRSYGSDSEYNGSPGSGQRRKKKSSVRFADDMNRELHDLHQNVRDLSSDQIRLEEHLHHEIERRERSNSDTRNNLRDLGRSASDPLTSRIEQRLTAIQNEIRSERHLMDRQDDLHSLSSELKQAIHQVAVQPVEDRLRSQCLQAESHRFKLESELDSMRRKLGQSEGSKSALQNQVEELRAQLNRMELDRHKMKSFIDGALMEGEFRGKHSRRASDDVRERNLENEIYELRSQLTRSVGMISEMETLRKAFDNSERQRAQLSDHLKTLAHDLENREKQAAKAITQLNETSDKLKETEQQKAIVLHQLENVTKKLGDVSKDLDKSSQELRSTQVALQEAERKKDEFKIRAQETIRQWKAKLKQLERDLDRSKHGAAQVIQRNEQLIKEMEQQKQHRGFTHMQVDGLKRELQDALAVRAAQDEQIRLKDIEINEMKSIRMDLEQELKDSHSLAEKHAQELHILRDHAAGLSDDRQQLEDRLSAADAALRLSQGHAVELQGELKELSTLKADLAAQLSESTGKIHVLQQKLIELQHREKAAKEETEIYKKQLFEERSGLTKDYDALKLELNEAKMREVHTMQEVNRKFKRGQAEFEAALEALKLELSEEKSVSKVARRNEEKLKQEVELLEKQLKKYKEDNNNVLLKIDLMRQESDARVYFAGDSVNRVKRLEDQLVRAHTELENLDKQQLTLMHDIALEIDAILELACMDVATSMCQPINGIKGLHSLGAPNILLTEIKNKLIWLRGELKGRVIREQHLRREFRQVLIASDTDQQILMSQLMHRDEELDELAAEKREIALKEIETFSAVEALEQGLVKLSVSPKINQITDSDVKLAIECKEKVLDLSDELHMAKVKQADQENTFEQEKQHIIDELEDHMISENEKEKINQRYLKLQDTLRSLHDDLHSTSVSSHNKERAVKKGKGSILRTSIPASTQKNRNRVRIRENSSVHNGGSQSSLNDLDQTPPPMSLSDEDFKKRFFPQAAQNGDISMFDELV